MQLFKLIMLFLLLVGIVACSPSSKEPETTIIGNSVEKQALVEEVSVVDSVKVAILGDQGVGTYSQSILELIKQEKAELLLINGDFDYEDNPEKWEKTNRDILGADFPIIAVAGNHDVAKWDEYQEIIAKWQLNPQLSCSGEAGVMTDCSYKGIKIVSTSPAIFSSPTIEENEAFIKDTLDKDRSIWRICAWHKNMRDMQTGAKIDETGWGVYEECRRQGALITTGHEHAYARSFLLSDIANKKVVSKSDSMELAKGKTVVILSGLGGESTRPLAHDADWWAAKENADTGTHAGVLFCSFGVDGDAKKASCYFMDDQATILDKFEFRSSVNK